MLSCHGDAGEAATTEKSGTRRRSRVGQSWEEADRRGQRCARVRTRRRLGAAAGVPSRNDKLLVGFGVGSGLVLFCFVLFWGVGLKVYSFFVLFFSFCHGGNDQWNTFSFGWVVNDFARGSRLGLYMPYAVSS